jgi:hypothetical protein
MKENEVDRTWGMHGRREESVKGFWWEIPKEGDHLGNQGSDGRMESE